MKQVGTYLGTNIRIDSRNKYRLGRQFIENELPQSLLSVDKAIITNWNREVNWKLFRISS